MASSDWGGALLLPERPALQRDVDDHLAARRAAGGDPIVARHLPDLMAAAGFELLDVGARYECESPPTAFATVPGRPPAGAPRGHRGLGRGARRALRDDVGARRRRARSL